MELRVDPSAKALIFDLDGTLVDSMPLHYEVWKEICEEKLSFHFTEDLFYAFAGFSANKIFNEIKKITGKEFDHDDLADQKEKRFESKIHQLKVVQPVVEIVKAYHNKLPKAIGTGSPTEGSWKSVRAMGLDKYFDILVSKEDVDHPKPAPDTFLRCAELMGVNPTDCQVFEDGDPGLQAARTAGMIATDIRPFINGKR
jgi:HAD superfamily hydrolase (TIGR01509 family)